MFQAKGLQKCAQSWAPSCQSPWCLEKSYNPQLLADLGEKQGPRNVGALPVGPWTAF